MNQTATFTGYLGAGSGLNPVHVRDAGEPWRLENEKGLSVLGGVL